MSEGTARAELAFCANWLSLSVPRHPWRVGRWTVMVIHEPASTTRATGRSCWTGSPTSPRACVIWSGCGAASASCAGSAARSMAGGGRWRTGCVAARAVGRRRRLPQGRSSRALARRCGCGSPLAGTSLTRRTASRRSGFSTCSAWAATRPRGHGCTSPPRDGQARSRPAGGRRRDRRELRRRRAARHRRPRRGRQGDHRDRWSRTAKGRWACADATRRQRDVRRPAIGRSRTRTTSRSLTVNDPRPHHRQQPPCATSSTASSIHQP
jgi:hypothetical protein